jgi:hypothetical protein
MQLRFFKGKEVIVGCYNTRNTSLFTKQGQPRKRENLISQDAYNVYPEKK